MSIEEILFEACGIKFAAKKAYMALFNSPEHKAVAKKVIEDLIIKFKYYGAKPTTDPIQLAKNAAYREIIEYILTMSARVSDDTLNDIEEFINKK